MTPPVLFIVFRRPALTERVFDAIAAARPPRLFLAADGPASQKDAEACAEVRRIVTKVTWPCDVQTDFSPANLGCNRRVTSAIHWFMDACEAGIILEDDCLPAPDFFRFCEAMLERYARDERIVHVSGENYRRVRASEDSYYFSKYALAWGWATWRRAWRRFDMRMSTWPRFRQASAGLDVYDSEDERRYWDATFEQMYQGVQPSWDYPWMFACLANGLSIHPAANLVRNISTSEGATHMTDNPFSGRPEETLDPVLRHPEWVVRDRQADLDTFDDRFVGTILKRQRTLAHHAGRPWRWLRRTVAPSPRR